MISDTQQIFRVKVNEAGTVGEIAISERFIGWHWPWWKWTRRGRRRTGGQGKGGRRGEVKPGLKFPSGENMSSWEKKVCDNTISKFCERSWSGVAVWKWLANDDTCGICRSPLQWWHTWCPCKSNIWHGEKFFAKGLYNTYRVAFDGCCPDCKFAGDDCPLVCMNHKCLGSIAVVCYKSTLPRCGVSAVTVSTFTASWSGWAPSRPSTSAPCVGRSGSSKSEFYIWRLKIWLCQDCSGMTFNLG